MRKLNNNLKASVIVVNYNNSKYINRCINSLKKQTYKNLELIFVDDCSTDNSIFVAKKFKRIKILKTSNKTKHGSYNQINAYKKGLSKSKGEIIFFLDSDDFYKKNKVKKIVNYFKQNDAHLCFDKPILYFNKKKKFKHKIIGRNKFLVPWPQFGPQSCIAIRKKYLLRILPKISIYKFENIWFDFRLINQAYLDFNKVHSVPDYLTFYQQNDSTISSKFRKFSKNWWKRRNEAHDFLKYLYNRNGKKFFLSLDYFVTYIINKVI